MVNYFSLYSPWNHHSDPVEAYGRDIFRFAENNIKVTIPFDRIERATDVQVTGENTPVITPVEGKNTLVTTPVSSKDGSIKDRILEYCKEPKGILKISAYLDYKEKKTVSTSDTQVNVQVNAQVEGNEELSAAEKRMAFCSEPKSLLEIAEYLGYKDHRSVRKTLNPLLEQSRIAMTVPEKPNSRLQKYITIK